MEKNGVSYFKDSIGTILNPLFVILLTITQAWCQKSNDYIIKLNGDTLYTKVIRIDKEMKDVLCEENGKKTKYEAKDILGVKYDSSFYETGLVKLKRSKRYVFLRRTVKGTLNLYEITESGSKFLWGNFGEDLIRFRWVYRAQDWSKRVSTVVSFYKKENEAKDKFSKSWKEKVKDCKPLQEKINSKIASWIPTPKELVEFYNKTCH
jgi:hypothetical protein